MLINKIRHLSQEVLKTFRKTELQKSVDILYYSFYHFEKLVLYRLINANI